MIVCAAGRLYWDVASDAVTSTSDFLAYFAVLASAASSVHLASAASAAVPASAAAVLAYQLDSSPGHRHICYMRT